MIRILLSGCYGKMGRVITAIAQERKDCEIAAGIDLRSSTESSFPVYSSPLLVETQADVAIDFSHPALLSPLLEYGKKKKLPLVLCTTGYEKKQVQELQEASKSIPIFYSRNMSLGINLLMELSRKAAQVLGNDFDIEIVEKHHNQKIDAPSGTALMLADEISEAASSEMHYMYDRHSQRKRRDASEIGIHSVRGGTIVGEHEVIFAGRQEVLSLSHSAQSKEVFANGAVNAALFLTKQKAGLYDMADLLK